MKRYLILCLAVLFLFGVYNCGGSSSTPSSPVSTTSYAGPGSRWQIEFHNDGTFDSTESDSSLEVSGAWIEKTSGFKELTVTATNNAGAVALGSKGYGLEIPGVVFILKPFDGDQIITMVESGQCPSGDVSANWIMTNKHVDISSNDVMGTFAYTHASTSAILPTKYYMDRSDAGTNWPLGSFTCNDGVATVSDGLMYLTEIGGAIVHTNSGTPADKSDDQFIVALPANPIGTVGDLDGEYVGLVFAGGSGGDELFPVEVTLSGGSGTGAEILDHDTGNLSGDTVNVVVNSIVDSPSDGFVYGTVGGADFVAMGNVDVNGSGKNFLFIIGKNPGEPTQLYNMLLISK